MKLLIGLGNPGEKYKNNRHNVGHMIVDYLKRHPLLLRHPRESGDLQILDQVEDDVGLVKTDCFMNVSGAFVGKLIKRHGLNVGRDLVIVHDDLDIPFGNFKIQKGEGPRLHNGLKSIEESLKTKDFWRIRIGVDTRTPENWVDGETYVLTDFTDDEKNHLPEVFTEILTFLKKELT